MTYPKQPKKKSGQTTNDNNQLPVAQAAFEKLQPDLDAMSPAGLESPRVDLQAAAVQALSVAEALSEPSTRATIGVLAKQGVVDRKRLEGLEAAAWAAWYARHKFLAAGATHSGAALPPSLVQQGYEIRGRMLKTLSYHLEDDTEAMAKITHLRAGAGHLDLANDLSGAAEMYRKHHGAIQYDKKNFRDTDERDAMALSEQILRLLGATATPEQALWKSYQARAAKLLFERYDEAIRVGRFLFFYDDPEGRFPSLFAATRTPPAAPRDKKTESGENKPPAAPVTQPDA